MTPLLRFAMVGSAGFLVDSLVLLILVSAGFGPYLGRLGSWLVAASFTWIFNRRFTFKDHTPPSYQQWGQYLLINSVGGFVNYMTYALLLSSLSFFSDYLPLAVAAGSLTGMLFNFTGSYRWIFRKNTTIKQK